VHIAFSTFSAFCDYKAIVFVGKVPKELAGISISNLSAHRYQQRVIITAFASLLFAATVGSTGRLEVTLEVEIKEGLFSTCGLEHHITAFATISTIRATARHVFFTSKTNAPLAAVTGPNVDLDLINKTHGQR
jgi:hypothetical protein